MNDSTNTAPPSPAKLAPCDHDGQPLGARAEVHQRVVEYDGAFRCLDCGAMWGAVPGRPTEPETCQRAPTPSPQGAREWECLTDGKSLVDWPHSKPHKDKSWVPIIVREAAGDGWRPIAEVPLKTDVLLYWPARMGRTLRPAYQMVGRVLYLEHYAGATHFQPLPPPPAQ